MQQVNNICALMIARLLFLILVPQTQCDIKEGIQICFDISMHSPPKFQMKVNH